MYLGLSLIKVSQIHVDLSIGRQPHLSFLLTVLEIFVIDFPIFHDFYTKIAFFALKITTLHTSDFQRK